MPDEYTARPAEHATPASLRNTESLEQVADRICDLLASSARSMSQAQAQRLEAATMLLAVRPRVEAEHPHGWNAWCRGNIRRSRSDIANLLTLARSFTPKAALEAQNAKRRAVAAERAAEKSLQRDVQPLDMTVAAEEKAAAEAAAQRQQQAMAAAFRADKEALEVKRVRAEQEAAAAALPADTAAIETNLDFSGHLLWSRVPFVMEKIGSVLSDKRNVARHAVNLGDGA